MGFCVGYGNPKEIKRIYLVYDARVLPKLDTSDSDVLSPCLTLGEAKVEVRNYFPDGVVFSYLDNGENIWDERFEWAFFMEDDESWEKERMKTETERAWPTSWISQHPKRKELIQQTVTSLLSSK